MLNPLDPNYYYGDHIKAVEELVDVLTRVSVVKSRNTARFIPVPEFGELARVLTGLVSTVEKDKNIRGPESNQDMAAEIQVLKTRIGILEDQLQANTSKEYRALQKLALWLEEHQK